MSDGSKLNYATPSKMMSDMDCSKIQFCNLLSLTNFSNFPSLDCARDEKIFKNAGIVFNLRCDNNGNYEAIQDQNGKIFCVDRDGYAVSGLLQSDSGMDCDHFFYYAQEDFFNEEEEQGNWF